MCKGIRKQNRSSMNQNARTEAVKNLVSLESESF